MKTITYTIKDELGIHARPAGLIVKLANGFKSDIKLAVGDRSGDAKRIIGVMKMAAKQGEDLTVTISGEDEDAAAAEIQKFLEANL